MEENSMTRNHGGGIIGRGIIEKESLRRKVCGRHLGGIWEASGKHLGGILEASEQHLGGIWKACGRLQGTPRNSSRPGCSRIKIDAFLS